MDTHCHVVTEVVEASPVADLATVVVWSLQDMIAIRARGLPREAQYPPFFYLPFVHKARMAAAIDEFDFFWYTEDDIVVPRASFDFYVSRHAELWDHGWLFGWGRFEKWAVDGVTPMASEGYGKHWNEPLFVTPSGHEYITSLVPYTGFYIHARAAVKAMIADPSGVWERGHVALYPREAIAVGYSFVHDGSSRPSATFTFAIEGWHSRMLWAVDMPGGSINHHTIAWHVTNKYTRERVKWGVAESPIYDMLNWTSGVVPQPQPLPQCRVAADCPCLRRPPLQCK